jgi:hypothetical protein
MDISMDLAWEILQNYDLGGGCIDLDKIISFICQAYGFGFDELCSKSRKRDRVVARNTAFYLARKHTDLSLVDIGRRFNRKHSTVIKGITSVVQDVARKTRLGNQIARTSASCRLTADPVFPCPENYQGPCAFLKRTGLRRWFIGSGDLGRSADQFSPRTDRAAPSPAFLAWPRWSRS